MPFVADRCICLRKLDYSETSQILLLFSREHGTVRVIAKGALRRTRKGDSRFDGGLDLLDLGSGVFQHDPSRELALLTEWRLIDGHLVLRSRLRTIYLAQYAAELISLLIEQHDPHPPLFDLTERMLQDLATPRLEETFLLYQFALLREAGYLPEMFSCVACGRATHGPELADFSPAHSGILCEDCRLAFPDRMGIDPRLIRLAQNILRLPSDEAVRRLPRLTRHQTNPLNALLAAHIQHTLQRPLRLASYIL